MADAPDIEMLVYRRVRALLEDDATWSTAIEEGNRIWFDVEQPNDPVKPTSADGDHPSSKMRTRAGSSSLYTTDETFGTYDSDSSELSSSVEQGSLILNLTLTSQLLGQEEGSNLRTITINVIRKAGPRLGLSYVTRVTSRWDTEEFDIDPESATRRERTRIDITVVYEAVSSFLRGG